VAKLRAAFDLVAPPVATPAQMQENLEALGLPVAMHAAVVCGARPTTGMHALGPESLMHVVHGSAAALVQSTIKSMTRLVRARCKCMACMRMCMRMRPAADPCVSRCCRWRRARRRESLSG
jgi:hypothetical protein